jgi:SanA protein
MKRWRKSCLALLGLLTVLAAAPPAWRLAVRWTQARHIYSVETAPAERTAIVFGAAVYGNGRLSPILRDRMDTAIALYHSGRVQRLLVSGDNSSLDYNEPGAMQAYAIAQGVPAAHVQPDYGGRRTYDTCYRARDVFQIDRAILVTQAFHLPRALFTCRALGVEAVGVTADLRPYRGARWYAIRETGATAAALLDVLRRNPPPILGEPIYFD